MSGPAAPAGGPAAPDAGPPPPIDEPPPFWGRWGRIYAVVAALLGAQILAYGLLTEWAR